MHSQFDHSASNLNYLALDQQRFLHLHSRAKLAEEIFEADSAIAVPPYLAVLSRHRNISDADVILKSATDTHQVLGDHMDNLKVLRGHRLQYKVWLSWSFEVK